MKHVGWGLPQFNNFFQDLAEVAVVDAWNLSEMAAKG